MAANVNEETGVASEVFADTQPYGELKIVGDDAEAISHVVAKLINTLKTWPEIQGGTVDVAASVGAITETQLVYKMPTHSLDELFKDLGLPEIDPSLQEPKDKNTIRR